MPLEPLEVEVERAALPRPHPRRGWLVSFSPLPLAAAACTSLAWPSLAWKTPAPRTSS
jgi:hypothetical protein